MRLISGRTGMKRPVRPVALEILTACMLYPGVTMLYQGSIRS